MTFSINKTPILLKKIFNSFKPVYGINKIKIKKLIKFLGFKPTLLITDLTSEQIQTIKFFFENKESLFFLEDRLRKMQLAVNALMEMQSYKGSRHQKHLPANGQRSHGNGKTCKRVHIIKELNLNPTLLVKKKLKILKPVSKIVTKKTKKVSKKK